jgi:ABC-type transport system substrate-binding protein
MSIRGARSALVAAFVAIACIGASVDAARAADGTMTWGVHVSLTPAFFDPADATGTALPLMVYYGVHDALVRPMPGTQMGNALAYPEVDGLWKAQASEVNPRARRQILEKMQQIIHERAMFAPVLEYAYLVSIGPRVEFDAVNAIPANPYTAPYEDLRLKALGGARR